MSRPLDKNSLGDVARAGFQELSWARAAITTLADTLGDEPQHFLDAFALAADADAALARLLELHDRHPQALNDLDTEQWQNLTLLFGASPGIGTFFVRHPTRLGEILAAGGRLITREEATRELLSAIGAVDATPPCATAFTEQGVVALRRRYRELLAEVMLYDLRQGVAGEAEAAVEAVAASLSKLADAVLEAALAVARAQLIAGHSGNALPDEQVLATRLAIIAMGKSGANELNVVSDVDVLFVMDVQRDTAGEAVLQPDLALRIATRLASETMRVIHEHGQEPPLWQVDPNLRPEGKHGALVRSLQSMVNYYERWAKTWEFQALLKARPAAGDVELGEAFVAATRAMVWASSTRDDFVGSVQRMRERVTEHIAPEERDVQIKLGPGGLRDIEFSVQLLQLVHGPRDVSLHLGGTLPALRALVAGGFVAREDGDRLARHYRTLRLLEHRLQMRELRRSALVPRDDDELRVLARASRLAAGAEQLFALWRKVRNEVRELHLKIFYAPLLGAVAALPGDGFSLGNEEARARLESIGFRDPDGALRHLGALTKGSSRTAQIQRNLLPVLLQWLANGRDPDFGLLAFRRVSEASRSTPWYLRLLRDGAEAAERLTRVLSGSRFAAELLESLPESVAWLERDELLQPQSLETLRTEMRALVSRRQRVDDAAKALRTVHRREVLRLALGRLVGVLNDETVSEGLHAAHTALLDSLILAMRWDYDTPQVPQELPLVTGVIPLPSAGEVAEHRGEAESAKKPAALIELALIGMGRFGGGEMGFASDIDLIAVYRFNAQHDAGSDRLDQLANRARSEAERLVAELRRLVSDPRFSVDLDFDLRPEGKQGSIVRSLEAYRAYYERWSLTWEAQALLRARPVAGDRALGLAFTQLADEIRYPANFGEAEIREVRRIKARIEAERLPRGVDPRRHLKLGPGGVSDVEWFVQLLQLRNAAEIPELRTFSTMRALDAAATAGLVSAADRDLLREAWQLASSIRSAIMLWSGRASDVLPSDRNELEGIAGVLGMPEGHTTRLEERWFAVSRRARAVFEREFYGYAEELHYPGA